MKRKQNFKILMTIIITAIITFSVTMLWVYGGTGNMESSSLLGEAFKSDKLSTKLDLINEKINSEFMGEVNEDELIEWAVKGYVAGLKDKYSEY